MCGIAGKVFLSNASVSDSDLKVMAGKIAHRGPDDEGVYISPDRKVGLANRRLAIIDLSSKGHQPMNYKGRYWITFNGEIYNYQILKKKLMKDGCRFKSNSDTEVILALYDKYNTGCLKYLRGMFAFAIYDSSENTLFLARDRIGKKPLKYYFNDKVFIFSSELKAILTQSEVISRIDYEAIHSYLIFGYVPSPATGFENINKLEPGNYLLLNINKKSLIKKRYWEPYFGDKLSLSENDWCNNILSVLEESTKLRMISDVPIGAFLSGGVDSSAVVAAMARLSTKPISTFTIIFEDDKWNEAKYANNIKNLYNTNHHELLAEPENVEILPQLAYFYEEPFADASNVITYMVSQLAKKYVTVILNGDGGDENFAGYPNRYFRLKRDVNYYRWINEIRPAATLGLKALSKVSKSKLINKSKNFFEKSKLPLYQRFASYNQIFSFDEIQQITLGKLIDASYNQNPYYIVETCFELFKGRDLKDAGLKFDLLYWLPDDLLAKVDIASMANSLEARSPLLDHKMIELACKIPFNLKVKNGISKYILKKALKKIVPIENLYRPKMGFGVPLHLWFSGSLNKYSKAKLLSKKSKIKNLIKKENIKQMLELHGPEKDFGPKLWALLSLELWLDNYFN